MRPFRWIILALVAPALYAQVTTYTGTVKDLTGATVTSGRITWTLNAQSGGNIPGTGAFVGTAVSCLINSSGHPVSTVDGTSSCTVINNTALTPTGTSYVLCLQPNYSTPGSCYGTYALGGTVDISTVIPTPSTQPNYGFPGTGCPLSGCTFTGEIAAPYFVANGAVPFSSGGFAALGYGQNSNEADIYCGAGGCTFWVPNNMSNGWTPIGNLDISGNFTPQGDIDLTAGNCYFIGGSTVAGVCDDGLGGVSISTTSSATNGVSIYRAGVLQWQFDASGNLLNGAGHILLPAGSAAFVGTSAGGPHFVTGVTGTGNTAVVSTSPSIASPALTGTPTAPTATFGTSNTQVADTAFVQAAVSGSIAGVSAIDSQTGSFTFAGGGVSHVGNAYTFSSASGVTSVAAGPGISVTGTGSGPYTGAVTISALAFHADVSITGIAAVAAQACSAILQVNLGAFGTFGSGAFVALQAQSNYTSTTGWSPIVTPITPTIVPDPSLPNYVDIRACNTNASGGASITPATFGARILVVP